MSPERLSGMEKPNIRSNLDSISSEMVRALHSWWHLHCRGDIPERISLDPVDLKQLLANLVIADIEHAPFRVRYRLVGTNVVSAAGLDFTGRYLDELVPADRDGHRLLDYKTAYAGRLPVLGGSSVATSGGDRSPYEYGIFPLRNGGTPVAQFLELEDYFSPGRGVGTLTKWRIKR
jgi:hypothetical protein